MTSKVIHSDKICRRCGASFRYADAPQQWKRRIYCGQECAHAATRAKGPENFWAKVDKSAGEAGCWLYTGFRKWDGYGWLARATGDGKVRYMTAHRYAWVLTHGEPAAGLHILHECDNPPCCNPSHLRLGTHAENMKDMERKGRSWKGGSISSARRKWPTFHPDRVRPQRKETA